MRATKFIRNLARTGVSLLDAKLPEKPARTAVTIAALFNTVGMGLELIMLRGYPNIPRWPEYLSMAIGSTILILLLRGAFRRKTEWVNFLFLLNASAVSVALYALNTFNVLETGRSFFFQASKLGMLFASFLAPGFLVGLAAIAVHAGSSLVQYWLFPPEVQLAMGPEEPWPIVAFALAAFLVVVHRFRLLKFEQLTLGGRIELESMRRVSQSLLELRDRMNTPVQSIEIAILLLGKKATGDPLVLEQLKRSCEKLREINAVLKQYESHVDWKNGRGGLA